MYSKLFEFILNIVISTSRQVKSSMSQKIWSYIHIHTAYISAGLIILSGIISQRPNSSNYSLLHNYVNRPPHILVFMAYPKIFFFSACTYTHWSKFLYKKRKWSYTVGLFQRINKSCTFYFLKILRKKKLFWHWFYPLILQLQSLMYMHKFFCTFFSTNKDHCANE